MLRRRLIALGISTLFVAGIITTVLILEPQHGNDNNGTYIPVAPVTDDDVSVDE